MKKVTAILLLLTILISMFSSVSAAELKTTLSIVEKSSETKSLGQGNSSMDTKILSLDGEKGIVNMQLTINNLASDEAKYENTEIYILVSENLATDAAELSKYKGYIEELAENVFENSPNTKIGIIGMKGTIKDVIDNGDGTFSVGPEDEGDVLGSESNAEIVAALTNNLSDISDGLDNMNTAKKTYNTNLQAAIRLANNSYSANTNKMLISLYDNVPDLAIGVKEKISYGGWFSQYATVEEAVIAKNTNIVRYTKSEILKLKDNEVDFILLRPDDTSFDQTWFSTATGEVTLEFDGSPYVKDLYGTIEAPTYGTMYSLNSENLEKIVTENIYSDIIESTGAVLSDGKVTIEFSEKIRENFDITIENSSVDKGNLEDDGYVIWNVGDIETGKTATLKYSLAIKDMEDKDLLDKVFILNDKIELNYTNYLTTNKSVVLEKYPSVKLTEVKQNEIVKDKGEKDNTPATGIDVYTNIELTTILGIAGTLLIATIVYTKH